MRLKKCWKELKEYDNKNEYDQFPFIYSKGKYQSYNSANENFITVIEFIRQRRPTYVLECGTFEGRGTEYIARTMRFHSPRPHATLVTIDVGGCIDVMAEDHVTFMPNKEYEDSLAIRHARLALLQRDQFVNVIYKEGLTQHLLPEVLTEFPMDFIYEDASHLPNILMEDWKHLSTLTKKDCVICFDDMNRNPFVNWFKENVKGWDIYYTDRERGQLWVERKQHDL